MSIQERVKLQFKLLPAVVDQEQTFLEGVLFKKAEYGFEYDRENQKTTDIKDSIRVHCVDVNSMEDFQVKLPLDAKIPEGIQPFTKCSFKNMTGIRVQFNTYLSADSIQFESK